MAIRPWKKIGDPTPVTEEFYGKKIVEQVMCDPEGGRHNFYFFSVRDSVVVLAITQHNHVLLVREYKQGCDLVLEALVGGYCNQGETPEAAARRELEEETGFTAGRLISLGDALILPRHASARVQLFLALNCCPKAEGQHLDTTEEIEVLRMPLQQWLRHVVRCRSGDPFSAIATMRALPHLKRKIDAR